MLEVLDDVFVFSFYYNSIESNSFKSLINILFGFRCNELDKAKDQRF